jgi:hypothetical protein
MEANKGDYYKMVIDPKRRLLLGMLVIVLLSIVFSIGGWLLNATISNMNKNDNSYSKYYICRYIKIVFTLIKDLL